MSIIADMKPITIQKKVKVESPSGAIKEDWADVVSVGMALYLTDDMKYTQSVRYNESTHVGLTFNKDIDKNKHRLRDGDTIYTITKINTKGRLTSLLLKVVDTDV